jgi:hypothetical protein
MDDAEIAVFIAIMTVLVATAVIILNWIRGRHRIAEAQARNLHMPEASREMELLSRENAGLRGKVDRLEERLSVLERIATDPGQRTAREIESLR